MQLTSIIENGAELVEATEGEAWPGNPAWLNVSFRPRKSARSDFSGADIYVIFLDERLIYLGIYAGSKDDPYSGSALKDRWLKHVGTVTFRGKKLSLRPSAFQPPASMAEHPLFGELGAAGPNIRRSQGMEASHRKAMFAAEHSDLREQSIDEVLKRLTIGYVRADHRPDECWHSKKAAKRGLCEIEALLVQELCPPLNSATPAEAQGSRLGLHEVMDIIRQRLSSLSVKATDEQPIRMRSERSSASSRQAKAEVDELEPMTIFLEQASEEASEAIIALQDRCFRGNRFILYFTHGGRVARITAANNLRERNRPLITLEWRKRSKRFLLRSRLAPEQLLCCGFQGADAGSAGQMISEVMLPTSELAAEKILEVCHRAMHSGG